MSLMKMMSVCLSLLLLLEAVQVQANPTKYSRWSEYVEAHGSQVDRSENKCRHGGPIRDLCERCAKFTKNEVVFPLCCEGRENVRPWCKDFLEYTIE